MASNPVKSQSFDKSCRITKRVDFLSVYEKGRRYFFRYFVIYIKKNDKNTSRLGITVPKKVGSSVVRNRIKRILRECFRRVKFDFKENYDIVINAKKEAQCLDFKKSFNIFCKIVEMVNE